MPGHTIGQTSKRSQCGEHRVMQRHVPTHCERLLSDQSLMQPQTLALCQHSPFECLLSRRLSMTSPGQCALVQGRRCSLLAPQ